MERVSFGFGAPIGCEDASPSGRCLCTRTPAYAARGLGRCLARGGKEGGAPIGG